MVTYNIGSRTNASDLLSETVYNDPDQEAIIATAYVKTINSWQLIIKAQVIMAILCCQRLYIMILTKKLV